MDSKTGLVRATKTPKARIPMKTWSKTVSKTLITVLDESVILSRVRSHSSHANLTYMLSLEMDASGRRKVDRHCRRMGRQELSKPLCAVAINRGTHAW
jgi:hypothetical protein